MLEWKNSLFFIDGFTRVTASYGGYAQAARSPLAVAAFAECMRKRLRSAPSKDAAELFAWAYPPYDA